MAKNPDTEIAGTVGTDVPPDVVVDPGPPIEFVVAPPQNPPPSEAQMKWMTDHPSYRRISHSVLGRFTARGTLTSDGSFIPESKLPVHDGSGSFGVGVP